MVCCAVWSCRTGVGVSVGVDVVVSVPPPPTTPPCMNPGTGRRRAGGVAAALALLPWAGGGAKVGRDEAEPCPNSPEPAGRAFLPCALGEGKESGTEWGLRGGNGDCECPDSS